MKFEHLNLQLYLATIKLPRRTTSSWKGRIFALRIDGGVSAIRRFVVRHRPETRPVSYTHLTLPTILRV